MSGSIVDLLPPELQTVYGAAAGAFLVMGLFYWAAGIRIARSSLAVSTGMVVAGAAAWGLPGPTGISILTAAIIGFVVGVLAGAVAFRLVQGLVLAVCLALAVSGGYYRWQVAGPASRAPATTLSAKEMLISPERLAAGPEQAASRPTQVDVAAVQGAVQQVVSGVKDTAVRTWESIPPGQRMRMAILSLVAAVAGLVTALFFPKQTTWVVTAALGTALLVIPGYALLRVYAPQYQMYVPEAARWRWGGALFVMLVGMLLQRGLFWPPKPQPKKELAPKWAPD